MTRYPRTDGQIKSCETLRNFALYLNDMEELEMDSLIYGKDMPLGLTAAHWAARVGRADAE